MDSVYIKTIGDMYALSTSERAHAFLISAGFNITKECKDSAVTVISAVPGRGIIEKVHAQVEECNEAGSKIVFIGPIVTELPKKYLGFCKVSTDQLAVLPEIVEEALNDSIVSAIAQDKTDILSMPRKRTYATRELIPIASGYGESIRYFSPQEISDAIAHSASEGCSEIVLCAPDSAHWKHNDLKFVDLVNHLRAISLPVWIHLGKMSPDALLPQLDGFAEALSGDRLYYHCHLTVLSGDNVYLENLGASFHVEDVYHIIHILKRKVKGITFGVDVIGSHQDVSENHITETNKLLKVMIPEAITFMGDEGTAEVFKQTLDWTKRTENLTYKGWEGKCLMVACEDTYTYGYTQWYKRVVVPHVISPGFVTLKVVDAKTSYLLGELQQ